MDELIFAGNKYISSKRASKLTGYTPDYLGQICRADKMECRLVGRNWYINEREIKGNKKSFKKEQALGDRRAGAIEYERIEPELLYYSNDRRLLTPKINKIHTEEKEKDSPAGGEENVPVRIIKNPEVSVERYNQPRMVPKIDRQIAVRRQLVPKQQIHKGFSMAAAVALVLILTGVLLTAGTFTLEQAMHYSSEDKKNIDTSIQLANVQEILNIFISFRQDNHN